MFRQELANGVRHLHFSRSCTQLNANWLKLNLTHMPHNSHLLFLSAGGGGGGGGGELYPEGLSKGISLWYRPATFSWR